MEAIETQKNIVQSRAKEIDTGAVPLPLSNVMFGIPRKPDPTSSYSVPSASQPWTYASLVTQKKRIADLKIDTSSSGKIWEFPHTWENVLKTHFTSDFRKLFGLKSWTLNFTFEFRSMYQQLGQFVVFYSNLPQLLEHYHFGKINAAEDPFSYLVMTQLPHSKIPMGECVDLNVSLLWNSPHSSSFGTDSFITDVGTDAPEYDMGTLKLYVPFPMQVGKGVDSTMTVRIWTWLSDFNYSDYRPSDSIL